MNLFDCTALLLKAWLALTPWSGDRHESLESRTALYHPVAETVCKVTEDDLERAMLGAQSYWEGARLARYVLEDRCKDGPPGARCDEGYATGPWQVHRWCRKAWNQTRSRAERLEAGARCALSAARAGRKACGGLRGMFAYQTSISCSRLPPGTPARMSLTYRILEVLRGSAE